MSPFKTFWKKKSSDPPASSSTNSNSGVLPSSAPPEWAPAVGFTRYYGKLEDAPGTEYDAAEEFCDEVTLDSPQLLSSDTVERINKMGCSAWNLETPTSPRFVGHVWNSSNSKTPLGLTTVQTNSDCQSVCLFSNLPLIAGLYDTQGKTGVYYEVCIRKMKGVIAIGTASKPYPDWRLPGWNRMSAGYHLDDFCKFFENGGGGMDYTDLRRINPGDIIGCGYEFQTGALFYTYNGARLPTAFTGLYMPRQKQDVFAAIGVEGSCEFEVNFGGQFLRWNEGNEWAWRVEGHVGHLHGVGSLEEELPTYQEARYSFAP